MTRARRSRGRARVGRARRSNDNILTRRHRARGDAETRRRARRDDEGKDAPRARATREFSLTDVDAARARARDAGTRRECDREKTYETLVVHGVRMRSRDGAFSVRMKVPETVDS